MRTELPPKLKVYLQQIFGNDFCISWHSALDLSSSNLIIATDDNWGDDQVLLAPISNYPYNGIEKFCETAKKHSDKMFYVLTACPWLPEIFNDLNQDNAMAIFWGDTFLLHPKANYQGLMPVSQKKFSQTWHWTFLSRNRRMHRNFCAMYLLGKYLPDGMIRFDPSDLLEHESWDSFLSYLKYNRYRYHHALSRYYPVFDIGFQRVKQGQGYIVNNYEPTSKIDTTVTGIRDNFNLNLRHILKDSVVDIVAETVFINRTGTHTEKFLNSVYGYTFPIYLSMAGSVQHLRNLGFDMFDDVINHAYDKIHDPYTRLIKAVNDNLEILSNRAYAIAKWHDCRHRFDQNYLLIEQMYRGKDSCVLQNVQKQLEISINKKHEDRTA